LSLCAACHCQNCWCDDMTCILLLSN
jgi:hypothetical protein